MIWYLTQVLTDHGFASKSKLNSGWNANLPFCKYKVVNKAGFPSVKAGTGEMALLVNWIFPRILKGVFKESGLSLKIHVFNSKNNNFNNFISFFG